MDKRRFKFCIETLEDENFYLQLEDEFFIGTFEEARKEAERLSDEWESINSGLITRIELESHGIVEKRAI